MGNGNNEGPLSGMKFDFSDMHTKDPRTADMRDLARTRKSEETPPPSVISKPVQTGAGKVEKRICTVSLPRDLWDKMEDYEYYLKRVENRGKVTHTEVVVEALELFLGKKLKKISVKPSIPAE